MKGSKKKEKEEENKNNKKEEKEKEDNKDRQKKRGGKEDKKAGIAMKRKREGKHSGSREAEEAGKHEEVDEATRKCEPEGKKAKKQAKKGIPIAEEMRGAKDKYAYFHSHEGVAVDLLLEKGHGWCWNFEEDGTCVIDNVMVHTIKSFIGIACTKKGKCEEECVGACRRHKSYYAASRALKFFNRQKLPVCVMLLISDIHGQSVTGYVE